jgi:uncharacterized protein YjbJ (UPF0337 family)
MLNHRPAPESTEQQANDEQHEEHEEDDLRNLSGPDGNPAKAKHGGDQRHHKKYGSPVQHGSALQVDRCRQLTELPDFQLKNRTPLVNECNQRAEATKPMPSDPPASQNDKKWSRFNHCDAGMADFCTVCCWFAAIDDSVCRLHQRQDSVFQSTNKQLHSRSSAMSGKPEEMKGRVKEAAGAITDNDKLRREGKMDQAAGKVKEATEKAIDKTKEALKGH